MLLDARLLAESEETGRSIGRVYTWQSQCVTLGMSQDPAIALREGCPVGWAMRPTGGRAVIHGHDVTVGIVLSFDDLGILHFARGLRRVYRCATEPLILALRKCGFDAALGEDVENATGKGGMRSQDCFAAASANDVVDRNTGTKICGCAMRVSAKSVLIQASIPVRPPSIAPSQVFLRPAHQHHIALSEDSLRVALAQFLTIL